MQIRNIRFPALVILLMLSAPALTACVTDSGPSAMASAQAPTPPPAPLTHQQAALDCWMGTEKADAHMNLDKRADIVTQCIKDKMKASEGAAAAAEAGKPKPVRAGASRPKPKT
jgi:hypothetical protein